MNATGSGAVLVQAPGLASRVFRLTHEFAGGGLARAGSGPTADDVPAMLSKGELVVPARMVKAGAVNHLSGKIPGFSAGGVAGLPPWVAAQESDITGGWAGQEIGAMLSAMISGFKAQAATAGKLSSSPVRGLGVANLIPYFQQAMKDTDVSGSWLNDLITIASYESGFNVNAINLTDSNAAAGDPSRGLMQVIGTTFTAYHQPGTSWDIYDPTANIAAAINYIKSRYGTVFNVPGIVSLAHGGGYVGYDSGGILPPGLTMAYNGTGRNETVVPGGGAQNVTIVVENHGVIGSATETDAWLMASVNRLARTGKLTQAVKRAAGAR